MTDEPVLPELDARARSAAASLRAGVTELDLDLTAPGRWTQRGLVAAALVLIVGLLAGATYWVDRRNDEVRTVDQPKLLLFPDPLPSGFELFDLGGSENPLFGRDEAVVYERGSGRAVLAMWSQVQNFGPGQVSSELEVGGKPAFLEDLGPLEGVTVRVGPDRELWVMGRGLDRDEILDAANSARVAPDGRVSTVDAGVVSTMQLVGRARKDRLFPLMMVRSRIDDGLTLSWISRDPVGSGGLFLLVRDSGPIDKRLAELMLDGVRHVEVRGFDAIVGTARFEGAASVAVVQWSEDGHLVRVLAGASDRDEAAEFARSLHRVGRDDFDRLVAAAPKLARPTGAGETTVVESPTTTTGSTTTGG